VRQPYNVTRPHGAGPETRNHMIEPFFWVLLLLAGLHAISSTGSARALHAATRPRDSAPPASRPATSRWSLRVQRAGAYPATRLSIRWRSTSRPGDDCRFGFARPMRRTPLVREYESGESVGEGARAARQGKRAAACDPRGPGRCHCFFRCSDAVPVTRCASSPSILTMRRSAPSRARTGSLRRRGGVAGEAPT